jgi:copper homeostasis protein
MERDAASAVSQGVDGVVFGILDGAGNVAFAACRSLLHTVRPKVAVFHRAFDHVANPTKALEELIDLGFHRVLTSGGPPTAREGADRLRNLREQAAGRIEILPAGGIRAHNVREVIQRTGCDQVHASLRKPAATSLDVQQLGVADVTDTAAIVAMRSAFIGV